MLLLTPINELNADRFPVSIDAVVRTVRRAPQTLVTQEGLLRDETGEVAFTIWKDARVKELRRDRRYVFYRVGLGVRNNRLEVRVCEGARVFPVKNEKALHGVLRGIARMEQADRDRLARGARRAPRRPSSSHRNIYSLLISAGLFLWAVVMVLHFTGVLTEEKLRNIISGREGARRRAAAAVPDRTGVVEEVVAGGTIRVRVGDETWRVRYLGVEVPAPAAGEPALLDPALRRAINYQRYLVDGKEVRLEFESWAPPGGAEVRAYVFRGEELVNRLLLEKGMGRRAPSDRKYRYADLLEEAERKAREGKKGVWRTTK